MAAYYNEHDKHAAQWLRNLISLGVIAPGDVDERDIRDVTPKDLANYTQCHFFAGIGVWSYALRLAGWPDSRPVWTGSCPCQPFSAAGKGNGFDDERHLWPYWHWLIRQCRPETIFGEQVASKDSLAWIDLVCSDLEGTSYTGWIGDLCAAGFGAPHIRQRLYFVANAKRAGNGDARLRQARSSQSGMQRADGQRERFRIDVREPSTLCGMADPESVGLLGRSNDGDEGRRERASRQGCEVSELGDADEPRLEGRDLSECQRSDECASRSASDLVRPGPTNGIWRDADWLYCTDGKWRPVEPESFPLAPKSAFRMGSGGPFAGKSRAKMLKGYGNAVVAEQAAEFIRAYQDTLVVKKVRLV